MAFERENQTTNYGGGFESSGGGKFQGPPGGVRTRRPTTDYGSTMIQWMRHRRQGGVCMEQERPSPSYIIDMLPPGARPSCPADTIPVKHLHSSLNKIKHPVNVVRWTPDGRRLLTGSTSGEFTLWNGMGFNFETIMSAHESAIRAAVWSRSGDWLVSADQDGVVKYWQPNFNNVNAFQAHEAAIRDVAFAPTDSKFVTASDDATLKIWDFSSGSEVSTLTGHGWDAKAVDWHPTKGLLVSGSKDHQVKLWDPRNGRCLTTLHGHKNTLTKTIFEPSRGLMLATSARDQTARVFDLRMMRDVLLLRGHEKDIMTLTWHPIHPALLSSGGYDGCLNHYLLDEANHPDSTIISASPYDSLDPKNAPAQTIYPAHRIPHAHESSIWSLDWHPLGHILASGSNDRITRFWTRPRPGDVECYKDRFHLGDAAADAHGSWNRNRNQLQTRREEEEEEEVDDEAEGLVDQKMPAKQPTLPGLPGITAAMRGDGTSTGGPQQPQFPGMGPIPSSLPAIPNPALIPPGLIPGQIPSMAQLTEIFGGRLPFPPPAAGANGFPAPPAPGANGFPAPPIPGANGVPPPPSGFPAFPGFPGYPPPPPGMVAPSIARPPPSAPPPVQGYTQANGWQVAPASPPDGDQGGQGNARRRAPLPSQQDSLREEMRRGQFRGQGRV